MAENGGGLIVEGVHEAGRVEGCVVGRLTNAEVDDLVQRTNAGAARSPEQTTFTSVEDGGERLTVSVGSAGHLTLITALRFTALDATQRNAVFEAIDKVKALGTEVTGGQDGDLDGAEEEADDEED